MRYMYYATQYALVSRMLLVFVCVANVYVYRVLLPGLSDRI
jgi:hypothetical protein